MEKDPVITELHKIKDEIAKSCDYDLNRLYAMLKESERARKSAPSKSKKRSQIARIQRSTKSSRPRVS